MGDAVGLPGSEPGVKKSHIPFHIPEAVQPHFKLFKAHFKDNLVQSLFFFLAGLQGGTNILHGHKAAQLGVSPGPMRYRRGQGRSQ